mmetsp:Transcript_3458/g.4645  ORF Transcript_3458/g.4645 Transcript_3458/m.4645 type:complete len:344 (-) Transcript_3458:319-1350(-)
MVTVLDMSYNVTRVFPNTPRPRSYQIMEDIIMYQGCVSMAFNFFLLFVFHLRWQELKYGDQKRYVILLFVGNVVCSIFLNIQAILKNSSVIDYNDKLEVCVWMQKLPGTTYILGSWFLYLVLLGREKTVREGLQSILGDPSIFITRCRWVVNLVAKYIVPVYAFVCSLFFQGRLIWNDNACDTFIPTFTSVSMGVADTFLSVCLLYLFLDPVIRVQKNLSPLIRVPKNGSLNSEIDFYKVAKRNLFWSSVMILSTSACLFTLSATLHKVEIDDNLEIQWWRPFAYFLGQADLNVNTIAALAIYPGAWVPAKRKSLLKRIFRLDVSSEAELTHSKESLSVDNLL